MGYHGRVHSAAHRRRHRAGWAAVGGDVDGWVASGRGLGDEAAGFPEVAHCELAYGFDSEYTASDEEMAIHWGLHWELVNSGMVAADPVVETAEPGVVSRDPTQALAEM